MQLQLHYTKCTTPQLQLHYTTTTTTAALHHTTSSSCGWGDRPGDHCNHCSHSKKHSSNHLSVHQWIRSAIRDSQQPISPIGFLFLKLRHRLVRYYWYIDDVFPTLSRFPAFPSSCGFLIRSYWWPLNKEHFPRDRRTVEPQKKRSGKTTKKWASKQRREKAIDLFDPKTCTFRVQKCGKASIFRWDFMGI